MLKLLINIFIKAAILIVLLSIIGFGFRAFLPFSWGSLQLSSKLSFIDEHQLDPNIYFLGSSVSNRQIMPTQFDSIIGDNNLQSFNLAVDGTMPPHHFFLFEQLLKRDKTIDYVFMELDGFDHMPPKHFKTTFSKFYFSPRWYGWSMANLLFSPSITLKQKLFMSYKYTRSFIENLFFVGMRFDALKAATKKNRYSYRILNKHGDGFLYFNTAFTENEEQSRDKLKILSTTEENFSKAYAKQPNQLKSNFIYKHLLQQCLNDAEAAGVELYFIMSPRNSVLLSAEELLDIKHSLPDHRVIDLADPNLHEALYQEELRYDADHLNGAGAKKYTELLAHLFHEVKNKK